MGLAKLLGIAAVMGSVACSQTSGYAVMTWQELLKRDDVTFVVGGKQTNISQVKELMSIKDPNGRPLFSTFNTALAATTDFDVIDGGLVRDGKSVDMSKLGELLAIKNSWGEPYIRDLAGAVELIDEDVNDVKNIAKAGVLYQSDVIRLKDRLGGLAEDVEELKGIKRYDGKQYYNEFDTREFIVKGIPASYVSHLTKRDATTEEATVRIVDEEFIIDSHKNFTLDEIEKLEGLGIFEDEHNVQPWFPLLKYVELGGTVEEAKHYKAMGFSGYDICKYKLLGYDVADFDDAGKLVVHDSEKPDAIVVYSSMDRTNAFWRQNPAPARTFLDKLRTRYDVYPVVAESEEDVYEALDRVQGAHLLVVSGHGFHGSIALSSKHSLDISDKLTEHLSKLHPDARIYLDACLAGNRLGPKVAEQASGRTVFASKAIFGELDQWIIRIFPFEVKIDSDKYTYDSRYAR